MEKLIITQLVVDLPSPSLSLPSLTFLPSNSLSLSGPHWASLQRSPRSRSFLQIQLRDLGERCKLPQWGPGRSPCRKRILMHLRLSQRISWQHLSVVSGKKYKQCAGELSAPVDSSLRHYGSYHRIR